MMSINVFGHRLGTAEVESALVEHERRAPKLRWSAFPHEIKGQANFRLLSF